MLTMLGNLTLEVCCGEVSNGQPDDTSLAAYLTAGLTGGHVVGDEHLWTTADDCRTTAIGKTCMKWTTAAVLRSMCVLYMESFPPACGGREYV